MLTFFRRIRKGLLDGGRTSKYVLYAIGEILLVVIGILIALQINNWNEWRKDRIQESIVLSELIRELETNISLFESSVKVNNSRNNSSDIILKVISDKLAYSDTLDRHFFWALLRGQPFVNFTRNSYEALKNLGFDKVTNKELSKSIITLYEKVYRSNEEWRLYSNSYAVNDQEFWYEYFIDYGDRLKPLNYEVLVESPTIFSLLQGVKRFRQVYIDEAKGSLRETRRVLQLIKEELGEE